MSLKIFFDTNVVLDLILEREPFLDTATLFVKEALMQSCTLQTSALSAVNISYTTRKTHNSAKAKIAVTAILQNFIVSPIDQKIITLAHSANWKDFEDAVQYFSAIQDNADAIITRNQKDYEENKIPILSPEEGLQWLREVK